MVSTDPVYTFKAAKTGNCGNFEEATVFNYYLDNNEVIIGLPMRFTGYYSTK